MSEAPLQYLEEVLVVVSDIKLELELALRGWGVEGFRFRLRAKRERLKTFSGLLPEKQGQNLALAVLRVRHIRSTADGVQGCLAHKKLATLWDQHRALGAVGS